MYLVWDDAMEWYIKNYQGVRRLRINDKRVDELPVLDVGMPGLMAAMLVKSTGSRTVRPASTKAPLAKMTGESSKDDDASGMSEDPPCKNSPGGDGNKGLPPGGNGGGNGGSSDDDSMSSDGSEDEDPSSSQAGKYYKARTAMGKEMVEMLHSFATSPNVIQVPSWSTLACQ